MSRPLVLAWMLTIALVATAHAQPGEPTGITARLAAAAASAETSDWPAVERLAGPLASDPEVPAADRGEANRLLGLAAYHQRRLDAAEVHFLAYLQLDLDGRLDPSLYAPELVAYFENVRSTHAAELKALRPRPRRAVLLNLIPPAGQFQNHQPVKGWILGGLGFGLLAANLTSYLMLERWCSDGDLTCEPEGRSRSDTARTLVTVNQWSGALLIGAYAYGVIDGFRHYRRNPSITFRTGVMVSPTSVPGGTGIGIAGTF